jgi:hypothetical protein
VEHSENIPKQTSVDEEGVHKELATAVTNSSRIAPVNLEMSFAAEQLEERLDCLASPFASNEGLYKTPPKLNRLRSQWSTTSSASSILLLMHGSMVILQSNNEN